MKLRRRHRLSSQDGGIIAALANGQAFGLAPLVGMQIDKDAKSKDIQRSPQFLVKVEPLEDGGWYCPDCGNSNFPHASFCSNCGRVFT